MLRATNMAQSGKRSRKTATLDQPTVQDHLSIKVPRPVHSAYNREWDGWSPQLLSTLRMMSPFGLLPFGHGEEGHVEHPAESGNMPLQRSMQGRSQFFHLQDLPTEFANLLVTIHIPPHAAPPNSTLNTAATRYSLLYDMPLPKILARERWEETGVSNSSRRKWRSTKDDILRNVPTAISINQKTYVTMAFVEWVDRRIRLRMNLNALSRDLASSYLDAFILAARELQMPMTRPDRVIALVPSSSALDRMVDLCLDAFVPGIFEEHMRLARKLDGAGYRLDAEFKMAPKISVSERGTDGTVRSIFPFKCCIACRGARGLYMAAIEPQRTYETGEAYVLFLSPILKGRKSQCAGEPTQGCPSWMCFDNGPAYQLFALAAVGAQWPRQVYNSDEPPNPDPVVARNSVHLRRDACSVVSDPPHRRWFWAHHLCNKHADFVQFDACMAYALGRISAPVRLNDIKSIPLGGHFRLYEEDASLLLTFSAMRDVAKMTTEAASLSAAAKERLHLLFRSREILSHGAFQRVFGRTPPCKMLVTWATALGLNPHPVCGFYAYSDLQELQADMCRIGSWFTVVRMQGPHQPKRKPDESVVASASAPRHAPPISQPLLTTEQGTAVGKTADGALGTSLMGWGDIARRWESMGVQIPTATTTVESGWRANKVGIFEAQTQHISARRFRRYSEIVCLSLNYNLLHTWDMPDPRSSDKRVLALLDAAWERLSAGAGLAAMPAVSARTRFLEALRCARERNMDPQDSSDDDDQIGMMLAGES